MSRLEMIDDNDFTADELCPDAEQFDTSEPIDMDECDLCGDPCADVVQIESRDPKVGYRATLWLCEKCRPRRKE